jgi:hypothetical protein
MVHLDPRPWFQRSLLAGKLVFHRFSTFPRLRYPQRSLISIIVSAETELYHLDLAGGGKTMLHTPHMYTVPRVVLVDHIGVEMYTATHHNVVLNQFIRLSRPMMGDEERALVLLSWGEKGCTF